MSRSGIYEIYRMIDPSLHALHYRETEVLTEGGRVELKGNICSSAVAKRRSESRWEHWKTLNHIKEADDEWLTSDSESSIDNPRKRFSLDLQWLPCEVEFLSEGDTKVRITFYINNLSPDTHAGLYRALEDLLPVAIESWNEVLVKGGMGRWPCRIKTYGIQWAEDSLTEDSEDGDTSLSNNGSLDDRLLDYDEVNDNYTSMDGCGERTEVSAIYDSDSDIDLESHVPDWVQPDPSVSFSYKQSKSGQASKASIAPDSPRPRVQESRNHQFYSVDLRDTFDKPGLQVVVEIMGVVLRPKLSEYPTQEWEIGGTLSDQIVAAAISPFSSANVSEARISFRQQSDTPEHSSAVCCELCKSVLGTMSGVADALDLVEHPHDVEHRAVQELGSVALQTGRLVTWPTARHHREEPFRLIDSTKPGHRSYVKLWLVDPNYRLCSTRNVPPQQFGWWCREAMTLLQLAARARGKYLPPEIILMIRKYVFYAGRRAARIEARGTRDFLRQDQMECKDFMEMYSFKVYNAFDRVSSPYNKSWKCW